MREELAFIDFESRSKADIKLGLDRYFAEGQCEPMMLAYCLPGETEIKQWHRGFDMSGSTELPEDLAAYVRAGGLISAFNISFEFQCWTRICTPKYGWPELKLEQLRDTMALAAAHNLPQSLGRCAEVLGLGADKQKDKRGKYLIQRLCKPHPPTKARPGIWVEDPELFAEFLEYNKQDVVAEMAVAKKLRPLSPAELEVWRMTQRLNARGVPLAIDEIQVIAEVVELEKARLNGELATLTDKAVLKASNRNGLLAWCNSQMADFDGMIDFEDPVDQDEERPGHEEPLLENMRGKTVDEVLKRTDLPAAVRRALEIRAAVVQTSTAKFSKMLKIAADDGTAKNLFVYHGAGTGRWASRGGLNCQNFARPLVKQPDIDIAFEMIAFGVRESPTAAHEALYLLFGDRVMDAMVSCLRGAIKAPEGCEFIDADYSSVENRVGVWLAGQADKLQMFAEGLDEYRQFSSTSLHRVPYDQVTPAMRQMSKSAVLGCFGAGTLVLTHRGLVPIVDVTFLDKVWDGVEWVRHSGVAYRGDKQVINLAGVEVTPDHEILTGDGWQTASTANLKSALDLAIGSLYPTNAPDAARSSAACVALAGESRSSLSAPCAKGPRAAAGSAPMEGRMSCSEPAQGSRPSSRDRSIGSDGSTEGLRRSAGATNPQAAGTRTTAAEALLFAMSGETTPGCFCNGSFNSRAGTVQSSSLSGSTTTAPIPPATAPSPLEQSSSATDETPSGFPGLGANSARPISGRNSARGIEAQAPSSRSCGEASGQPGSSRTRIVAVVPTFDVINAGPRNRFTIWTEEGPLIVHNCMFGQGWKGLIEYSKGFGIELTDERSQEIVKAYRGEYAKVRDLWYECGDASIAAVQNPGQWIPAGEKLELVCHKGFLWMRLPSRRLISWYAPKIESRLAPWKKKVTRTVPDGKGGWEVIVVEEDVYKDVVTVEGVDQKTRQWKRFALIGSSIFQSAVQGTARDILASGTLVAEAAGYEPVLLAHDENMALVRKGWGDPDEFGRLLCTREPWFEDLPLAFEAWSGPRFAK